MTKHLQTKQPDINISGCLYSRALEIIANKWAALVIYGLKEGSMRYGELKRRIDGISKKMLTQTLRQLERDGLVHREITPTVPPIVEYSLTLLGESLLVPLTELEDWAMNHYARVEESREEYEKKEEIY